MTILSKKECERIRAIAKAEQDEDTFDLLDTITALRAEVDTLRGHLRYALEQVTNTLIFKSAYGDTICASCDTKIDFNGAERPHKSDCPFVALQKAAGQ